nr:LOW QUALITY PROTEIN: alanine and arginine-rich domain-containing protein [Equus asinus]
MSISATFFGDGGTEEGGRRGWETGSASEWRSNSRVPLGRGPASSASCPRLCPSPPGNSSPGKQGAGDTCLEGWHRHLSDGPGASRRRRNRASRGPRRVPGRAGVWPSAPRPARGFPGGGRTSVSAPEEAPAARQLLEDLRRRLASAFQRAAAREQQSRACIEGALGRLSAELLEMHFQNRQLVRTVLDLNMKMQQLKKEYELEIASKSQSSEDNALNRE